MLKSPIIKMVDLFLTNTMYDFDIHLLNLFICRTFSTDQVHGKSTTDSLLSKYGQLILRPSDINQVSRYFS